MLEAGIPGDSRSGSCGMPPIDYTVKRVVEKE